MDDRLMANMERDMLSNLWNGNEWRPGSNATTCTSEPGPSITLADLEHTAKMLRDMPPVPRAFYFIERPVRYAEFMRLLHEQQIVPGDVLPFGSISVFCLTLDDIKDDWPPFKESGIWIEMSDGKHQRLAETPQEVAFAQYVKWREGERNDR